MKVFVTDGEQRPALAIVRALGREGATVIVGADQPGSLSSSSKYCAGDVTYPNPTHDREAFEGFLTDFLAHERPDVVMPVTDVATYAICSRQDLFRRYSALAVPPCDAFDLVSNKRKLLVRAAGCGLRIPHSLFVEGIAGLNAVLDRVAYPAVVKPVRSRIRTANGWTATSVHYANSDREIEELYRANDYLARYPSLIQERITGAGVGMFGLFDRGELVAEFAHRRLREKPPSGGVSVLRESVAVDPVVRQNAVRLLGPLRWHGAAMIEFKEDWQTGELVLMEVNGRFWGSLQLAIDAGVNFPVMACDLARGKRPAAAPGYKPGVRSRWLLGDFDHLLLRLFKPNRDLHLPEDAPSRLRTLVDFMKFTSPDLHYEILNRDDPKPFLKELRQSLASLASSAPRFVQSRTRHAGDRDEIPATADTAPLIR